MIPRRILCTHVSLSTVKPRLRKCLERMQALHPEWEFLFFSDADCREFVRKQAPGWLEIYDWYPRPVQRADFFRVLAVYVLGGFYFDTDVWLARNLEPLRKQHAVFPWEMKFSDEEYELRFPPARREKVERWQVGNYAFAGRADHPFLRAVLDEMVRRTDWFDPANCSDSDVLQTTGPDVVTTVYYRQREKWDVEVMRGATELKVPGHQRGTTMPGDWFRFGKYGTHLITGSWRVR